jgi:hypothetical protein
MSTCIKKLNEIEDEIRYFTKQESKNFWYKTPKELSNKLQLMKHKFSTVLKENTKPTRPELIAKIKVEKAILEAEYGIIRKCEYEEDSDDIFELSLGMFGIPMALAALARLIDFIIVEIKLLFLDKEIEALEREEKTSQNKLYFFENPKNSAPSVEPSNFADSLNPL